MDPKRMTPLIVSPRDTLLHAVKQMDEVRCKLLLVLDNDQFAGLVSIGDIQRAIIRNVPLSEAVGTILRPDIVVCHAGDPESRIRAEMLRCRAAFMPLMAVDGSLADIVFWEDIFPDHAGMTQNRALDLPVVIMAGGAGSRLRPLTNVIPKPLLPFSHGTIIETIMDRFVQIGCSRFLVSLNYKAAMIRNYFADLPNKPYDITFFEEEKPLGTAGSLSLIADKLKTPFFVSNCDIVIDQDLGEVWDYHCGNRNELTVVAALKHIKLAYGSLITGEDGLLKEFSEKPEWVFKVNSGVYILEPQVLARIPMNAFLNMTDLIEQLIGAQSRVGVFPVSEGSWTDIGNWHDYRRIMALEP